MKPGDDIAAVIGMDDHVVEFEITPNRPDCLSVIGLAREAAVTFDKPLRLHTPDVPGSGEDIHDHVSIRINDPALCRKFLRTVAAESGAGVLIWGGFETHPLCPAMDTLKAVRYGSRLYEVIWSGEPQITGAVGMETALL